ncbi:MULTISPECIES: hypothetical protein [unclassified Variovorax]|uniref:hypothetical protein n=1 Tax=unclassified Variovorax TaxID=663243 RepID=UPI003F464C1F
MTVLTNSGFEAAARASSYGEMALVEMQMRSGTVRFTNWPLDVQVMGFTWQGLGRLGSIGPLHESEDGAEEKLTLKLSPVDVGTRALALGDPSEYQDRTMRIWLALLNADTQQISGTPVLRLVGVMDQMKIERDGTNASISMECRSASYNVRSNPAALRMNHAQHQARYAGERGFEYLTGLIGTPSLWISKFLQAYLTYWATIKAKNQ